MIVTFWFEEFNKFKDIQAILDSNMSDFFTPFNLTGVPATIDPIVPRIVATTLGGHTNFNMSKINVQLQTHFDNDFVTDFTKCFEYVKDKACKVFDILTTKCDLKVLYSAVVVNCEYETENPVDKILTNIFHRENFASSNYIEMGAKFSEIISDKFYSITALNDSKLVSFTKKIDPGAKVYNIIFPLIAQKDVNIDKTAIAFVEEINDKCSFDKVDDYNSTKDVLEEIFDVCSDKIQTLLDNLEQGKLL